MTPTTLRAAAVRNDDAAAIIAALRCELGALADRVAVLERQARGRVDDDAALMRVLVGSVGDTVFSARELVAHARVDHELQAALRSRTTQQVGKRLRAMVDQPRGGFVLRRIGRDHAGTIWAVQVLDDLHAGSFLGGEAGEQ